MLEDPPKYPGMWDVVSSLLGIGYFVAWSLSFYPQLWVNHKRKTAVGLSPDYLWINPLGFTALTIWSWGIYFSPIAKRQYELRHEGHGAQVSVADLAFSLHAVIISLVWVFQAYYYTYFYPTRHTKRRRESILSLPEPEEWDPLLPERGDTDMAIAAQPTTPSLIFQLLIAACFTTGVGGAVFVAIGNFQFLDWLYLVSYIKLVITVIKYIPQVLLNWRLQSVHGFAIGNAILDLIGGIFSLAQLVIMSVFIEGDPGGIIANPVKLGLSFVSIIFDIILLTQKYVLYKSADDPAQR